MAGRWGCGTGTGSQARGAACGQLQGEVWAGALAGGSTPGSRARSWHTAPHGAPALAAALLPDRRNTEVYAQPQAPCADFPGKLFPWHGITRICPRVLPPGTAVFPRFGASAGAAGRSCLLPSGLPGTARGSGKPGTFRRATAQPSTCPVLPTPAALEAG